MKRCSTQIMWNLCLLNLCLLCLLRPHKLFNTHWQFQVLVRKWGNGNSQRFPVKTIKWYSFVNVNIKHIHAMWPSNLTLRYLPKVNKHVCPHKNVYVSIYSSIIHNSPKPETTQVDEQTVAHPHRGIPLSTKRKKMLIHSTIWVNPKSIMLSEKKLNTKDCILVFHLYENLEKAKLQRHQVSLQLPWGQEVGAWINHRGACGSILPWRTCPSLIMEQLCHCIQLAKFIDLSTWDLSYEGYVSTKLGWNYFLITRVSESLKERKKEKNVLA